MYPSSPPPHWLERANNVSRIASFVIDPPDGRKNVGSAITSWMGNSVGRWEGDTLVVETRNLKPESLVQGGQLSDEGVLIERFTRTADDVLEYRMTIDDPKTWTRPWTLLLPLPRDDDYGFYEYACHEGNYSMVNILSGSRAEEKRRAEAAAR